ncbi:hypothetical protein EVAR_49142_1 [Eumeta japonica]|uniref:Uncharacterized protein n=1 Tax=Eumeta variegata TaxID=151549 RepID=A0A4C1ZC06_EUMVA|nr:hypothetical protein EVAR_49142_1 [Eumeta japonica]
MRCLVEGGMGRWRGSGVVEDGVAYLYSLRVTQACSSIPNRDRVPGRGDTPGTTTDARQITSVVIIVVVRWLEAGFEGAAPAHRSQQSSPGSCRRTSYCERYHTHQASTCRDAADTIQQ